MLFDAKLAPHVAEFRGDFTLHYGAERESFRVKRCDEPDKIEISKIEILEYDRPSCPPATPRGRSREELLQVLRDAEELAVQWGLNSWGGLGRCFAESLAERVNASAQKKQLASELV